MTVALVANIARPISSAISTDFSADSYGAHSSYGIIGGSTNPDAVIEALFANSEQGVWRDQSDFSTMFQSGSGYNPVTAVGQSVGLILDKSKGLALGSEEVISPLAGAMGASWQVVGETIVRSGSTGVATLYTQGGVTLSTTSTYMISFTVSDHSGDDFGIKCGGGEIFGPFAGNGDFSLRIPAGGDANSAITIFPWNGTPATATFSNISVKTLAGNHASQFTAARRPKLQIDENGKYYLETDGADDGASTAAIDFTATDKITIFAGAGKSGWGGPQVFCGLDMAGSGAFSILPPNASNSNYDFRLKDNVRETASSYSAPDLAVLTCTHDIAASAGNETKARRNGTELSLTMTGDATGTFPNASHSLGVKSDGGWALWGRDYGLIVLDRIATTQEITDVETWLNGKTGAY